MEDNSDDCIAANSEEEVEEGDDGDDEYAPDDVESEDDDDDDEESYAEEFSTSEVEEEEEEEEEKEEEEDEDLLGPWGEKHPEIGKEIRSNSRVKFSSSETKYIQRWMSSNPTLGARTFYNYILSCPHARKIFHFHHVEFPERIDSKFKDMKKLLMK
jgi:hypothetical protein